MVHELKIKKCFADSVLSGEKTFEIRENDRGYQKGDLIIFQVVDETSFGGTFYVNHHELNNKVYKITYVLSGWGLEEGIVALGIMPFMKLND